MSQTGAKEGGESPTRGEAFLELVQVMRRLRAPGGCPWDREQTHESLVRYLIEETYEVVDAIEADDKKELREELGDLILQVVFHAEIAEDGGHFHVDDVCRSIVDKLIRRHPHVFSDETAETADDVETRWEEVKAKEKAARGDESGVLSGVPKHLPALAKAQRLTEKAGRVGFEWPDTGGVLAKMREELDELEAAIEAGDRQQVKAEYGDLLFVLANLARRIDVDAETALQGSNAKFMRRFAHVEARLAERGKRPADSGLEEMDALWDEAKSKE